MIRIAVTGPESTGKSNLCQQLAHHFKVGWVEEYARTYLEARKNNRYIFEDLTNIAFGQTRMLKQAEQSGDRIIICDTEMLVMKIWSEFVFGKTDSRIEELLDNQHFDFYLLCAIDLPWTPDPLREHPHEREELFLLYLNELKQRPYPFGIVSGLEQSRLSCALRLLKEAGIA